MDLIAWSLGHVAADLPINKFAAQHDEPSIQEGMEKIRRLDAKLTDKQLQLAAVERQTFPEKYAALDERRLTSHGQAVEDGLKQERKNRLKAARLARAFITCADDENDDNDDASSTAPSVPPQTGETRSGSARPVTSRMYGLKPQEEELIERILLQDEEELERNPFHVPELPGTVNVLMLPSSAQSHRVTTASSHHGFHRDNHRAVTAPSDAQTDRGLCPQTAASQASVADTTASQTNGKVDYLRQQRLAKEAMQIEREIDSKLRALHTSSHGPAITQDQLSDLLAQARLELQHAVSGVGYAD